MAKFKRSQDQLLTIQWNGRNICSLLAGLQNGTTILEENLIFPDKTKCNLAAHFSNSIPRFLPNDLKLKSK